ncbi:MAG: hypothetical protein Q9212_005520 [Teloschistes hypoglaucus]
MNDTSPLEPPSQRLSEARVINVFCGLLVHSIVIAIQSQASPQSLLQPQPLLEIPLNFLLPHLLYLLFGV